MAYEATLESVRQHQIPEWYNNAKLGIFIHWGLYSVPGYAPLGDDPFAMMRQRGFAHYVRHNPYAEWYLHTMKYPDSPTYKYHVETYGPNASYDDFVPLFKQAAAHWEPGAWAELCRRAGARYVVLTTRHCDSFPLWPTAHPNPLKGPDYVAERDLVGELTAAVRAEGMRMGCYYCTGFDWVFNPHRMEETVDIIATIPQDHAYIAFIEAQLRELIDRYYPDVLWGDVGYPAEGHALDIMAHYYNAVPDGVINDRFYQPRIPKTRFGLAAFRLLARLALKLSSRKGTGALPKAAHYDFRTPEYASPKGIQTSKWETCRGLGHSFGYNQMETAADTLTTEQLVHMLADIVSKNGNLLIDIGPMADGTVLEIQRQPLLGLGEWLAVNGEAIYGTRPWERAEGASREGLAVRFTRQGDTLYAIVLGQPRGTVTIEGLGHLAGSPVMLLGIDAPLTALADREALRIKLPEALPPSPAHVLRFALAATE